MWLVILGWFDYNNKNMTKEKRVRIVWSPSDYLAILPATTVERYDYALQEKVTPNTKIQITCKRHGCVSHPTASEHLNRGVGCPECGKERRIQLRKLPGPCGSMEAFLAKAEECHGDLYDYSKVVLGSTLDTVEVICHKTTDSVEHGPFYPSVSNHLYGKMTGCPICAVERRTKNPTTTRDGAQKRQKFTAERFLSEAQKVHGEKFVYDMTDFVDSTSKITAICTEHRVTFRLGVSDHISKKTQCPKCKSESIREALSAKGICASMDVFLSRAKEVHGDKYDYSHVMLGLVSDPIEVRCNIKPWHPPFFPVPSNHIHNETGCPACARETNGENKRQTTEEYVADCVATHGDKYDYSKVEYTHAHNMVTITCKECGDFQQIAYDHKAGHGCAGCSNTVSQPQIDIINLLKSKDLQVISDYKLPSGLEIDAYCPDLKIGFEYNGLHWHSAEFVKNTYHLGKTVEAEHQGIQLIHIFEDEWLYNREVCKSWILSKIGVFSKKTYARKCRVEEIPWATSKEFLDTHHIQGAGAPYSINLGLVENCSGTLLGVMTFSARERLPGEIELARFCTEGQVVGAFSKMLQYFIRHKSEGYSGVVSFSDRRWSPGGVYASQGFKAVKRLRPDYWWAKGQRRYDKRRFQHSKLAKELAVYDKDLSEAANCRANGYAKIYDCGKVKWLLTLPK